MNIIKIKKRIIKELNLKDLIIQNEGKYFQIIVIGDNFNKFNRLKQHQIIYSYFSKYIISNQIHSLSIKIYSTQKWLTKSIIAKK